jgi:hypothetical protein
VSNIVWLYIMDAELHVAIHLPSLIVPHSSLEVACWKDKYYDNNICDGTQWELVIRFPHRNKISKCGSNEYPPYWNKFIKIMKKYIGENIG